MQKEKEEERIGRRNFLFFTNIQTAKQVDKYGVKFDEKINAMVP